MWKNNHSYRRIPIFTIDANQDIEYVKSQIDLIINTVFKLNGPTIKNDNAPNVVSM